MLGEDHRDGKQEEADDEEVALCVELVSEKVGPGDAENAVRSACEFPVVERDARHLAETEGHDGEVVAAEPQGGIAEDRSRRTGEEHRKRQRGEEVPVGLGHEQGAGVGADREERGIAEVEQAGVSDHDVQAEPEHGVGRHRDRDRRDVVVAPGDHRGADSYQDDDDSRPVRRPAQAVTHGRVGAPHRTLCELGDHIRSATRSPNRPVGLPISTVIRTPNTTTSSHVPERYPVV